MRLLFINRYFWPDESATAQLLSDLAFHLAREGFQVTVLTGRTGYRDAKAVYASEETHQGVRIIRRGGARRGRVSGPAKLWDFTSFFAGMLPRLRRECREADWVISLTDPPLLSNFVDTFAARRCRRATWCMDIFPEIATLHARNPAVRLAGTILQKTRNRAFRHQQALIVLGKDMAEHLAAQNLPRTRLRVIPTWSVSPVEEADATEVESLRSSLGIPRRFTVGYSGNLGRVHEPLTAARAIKALPSDWSGQFVFFAQGRNLEVLRHELGKASPERVRFLPPQPLEHLNASLRIPDVHWFSLYPHFSKLVFPSKFSGILAAGRPCLFVGDPTCEIARLIGQFQCGFTIEPGDVDGFKRAVYTLQQDTDLRRSMGAAASRLYQTGFDRDRALQSWESLLQSHP